MKKTSNNDLWSLYIYTYVHTYKKNLKSIGCTALIFIEMEAIKIIS